MTDAQIDQVSAYGDGWYDGFLAAKKLLEEGEHIEDYSESDVMRLSEQAESESQLAKGSKPEEHQTYEQAQEAMFHEQLA